MREAVQRVVSEGCYDTDALGSDIWAMPALPSSGIFSDAAREVCVRALAGAWGAEIATELPNAWRALVYALQNDPALRIRYYALIGEVGDPGRGLQRWGAVPQVLDAILDAVTFPGSGPEAVAIRLAAARSLGDLSKAYLKDADAAAELFHLPYGFLVHQALKARFLAYSARYTGSDRAYGWRVVGNALWTLAPEGRDTLKDMVRVPPIVITRFAST